MHIQYADDTLLFIRTNSLMIERAKWALQAFEAISDLKINFIKSEVIPLHLSPEEGL
jgi:hypothetical protein